MNYKSLLSISLLLIFLFSTCIASAGTGSVKVISKDGKDITDKNHEEGDSDSKPQPSEPEEEVKQSTKNEVSGVEAVSDAVTTGGINIGYRIGDELLEGGFKLSSIDIEEKQVTGEKTMTYSLYSKQINPFKDESVRKSVFVTYLIHIGLTISFIFLAVCRYIGQTVDPKRTTRIMAGFSGEYVQFDVACFLILCVGMIIMPVIDVMGISYCLLNRNVIAGLMTARTLDIVGASTESLPTYILVNAAWYFNNLEKLFGEYAILTMTKLIIVKTWVQGVIVLFGSLTKAAFIQVGVIVGFLLVLLMDIITLFFVSSGIDYGVTDGSWGYALIGMIIAAIIDFFICAGLLTFPFLILYARLRSGRFGGNF